VELVLRVQGVPLLTVEGEVVRENHGPFAVRFEHPAPDAEDLIADLSAQALSGTHPPSIMVVDRSQAARRQVAESLYARGWQVLSAETPLEALTLLADPGNKITWMLVGEWLGRTSGYELIELVAAEYPEVKRGVFTNPVGWPRAHSALNEGHVHGAFIEPVIDDDLDPIGTWPPAVMSPP
jgi:CheY-like chemotaxis protein